MRRYDDPVEVRSGQVPPGQVSPGPDQFLWRGRVYVVREVLAHWVEVGAWWRERDADGLPRPVRATGREVWRVAATGRAAHSGVYDLTREGTGDPGSTEPPAPWRLARVLD